MRLQTSASVGLLLLSLCGCASTQAVAPPSVTVTLASDRLTAEDAAVFQDLARAAALEIARCLERSDSRRIEIVLDEKTRVPFTEDPDTVGKVVIRLPSGRMKPGRVTEAAVALHHELTHALAPGRRPDRLFAEGLGVHIQDLLGDASYPDFAETPGQAVLSLQAATGTRISLADSEAARLERPTGDERRLAYAQEGAFVRWLIATYGLERFFQVYENPDLELQSVFGADLQTLEAQWRLALGNGDSTDRLRYCLS